MGEQRARLEEVAARRRSVLLLGHRIGVIGIVAGLCACLGCSRMYVPHASLPQGDDTVCIDPQFEPDEPYWDFRFRSQTFEATVDCQRCNHALLDGVVEELHSLGFRTAVLDESRGIADHSCDYVMSFRPRISVAENLDFKRQFLVSVAFDPLLVTRVADDRRVLLREGRFRGKTIRVEGCVVDAWHGFYVEELFSERAQELFGRAFEGGARRTTEKLFRDVLRIAR